MYVNQCAMCCRQEPPLGLREPLGVRESLGLREPLDSAMLSQGKDVCQ